MVKLDMIHSVVTSENTDCRNGLVHPQDIGTKDSKADVFRDTAECRNETSRLSSGNG